MEREPSFNKEGELTPEEVEEKNKEKTTELEIEREMIKKRLDDIPSIIKNHSAVMENVKGELIYEIEKITDEIKERLKTIFEKI